MDNLKGLRKSFRIYGGYNRAEFLYRDELTFGLPLFWEADLRYSHDNLYSRRPEYHRLDSYLTLGWRPFPDMRMGIRTGIESFFPSGKADSRTLILYGTENSLDALINPFFLTERKVQAGTGLVTFRLRGENKLYVPLSSAFLFSGSVAYGYKKLVLACRGSSGLSLTEIPFRRRFDLYGTEDMSVRSGYPFEELQKKDFILLSQEIRFDIVSSFIPPFFNTRVELFLFADEAWSEVFQDAFGFGTRLKIENPVFAYFTFAFGWNHEGSFRFTLTGTAGF